MTDTHDPRVRCTVSVRVPVEGGKYRFDRLDHRTSQRGAVWEVMTPPQRDDLVLLDTGLFRVVDRMWIYNGYGSVNWPTGEQDQLIGPSLDLIVEPADGMYDLEASADTESEA